MLTLINFIITVYCETKLSPPTFKNKNNSHTAILNLGGALNVKNYCIMEGELDAKESDFTAIQRFSDQEGYIDELEVSLDEIDMISANMQYSISVTTDDDTLYSEPFRYCTNEKKFKLVRRFKDDPWYIKHKYIVGGAIIAVLVGFGAYMLKKYVKNKEEDSL